MNIGIDAKWYFNGHPSGKVVVESIVNHIVKLDHEVNFFIFLDKKDEALDFPIDERHVHPVYVPNTLNAVTNFFIMPFYTRKYRLDVCRYQNYAPFFGAKKIVNYVHDALFMDYKSFFSFKERLYFLPMKYLSRHADHVITISHSEKERMIRHNFGKKENISVVHHGLGLVNETHMADVDFIKKYDLPQKYILYLGRLNVRKNIQNLLKAMVYIRKDTSLVIVGKDDHKTLDWEGIIDNLDIKDRVLKVGYVEAEDIQSFYRSASVFCFPSFAEGFGLPPLEAMFYDTPVVVSNTTSLPEVCGDAALYIDPNDPEDIAEKISVILNDPTVNMDLKKKGKDRIAMFSWEKASSEILSILKSI